MGLTGLGDMKRIYLVGAPGSGKSYLAERLSRSLGVQWYDLDSDDYASLPLYEQHAYFRRIQQQESWICEAVYGGLSYDWVQKADITIILAPARVVRIWRIVVRAAAKRRGVHFAGQPGPESWASFIFRLAGTWRYDKDILDPFVRQIPGQDHAIVCIANNLAVLKMLVPVSDCVPKVLSRIDKS